MRVISAAAVLLSLAACVPPTARNGELLLSNPETIRMRVEAVVTTHSPCAWHGPGTVSTAEFWLPAGATRFIAAPKGADVCWRQAAVMPAPDKPKWSGWSRALTGAGRIIDSDL